MAQTHPQFEVASIRPAGELSNAQVNLGFHIDGAQLHVNSMTLKDCIAIAYRLKISQVSGPDWISSQRWNIAATIPAGLAGQEREMLQALLNDRFRIKSHNEKREFPVYALIVGKPPLKLKESPIDSSDTDPKGSTTLAGGGSAAGIGVNLGHGASYSFVPNRFEAKKITLAQFAVNIERFADRPVVDMTGLKSTYDFSFEVSPEDYQPLLIRAAVAAGVSLPPQALRLLDSSSPAVLVDAIAQTGLRLDARKAPLDVIVVDDALKMPTEN
jgi:uncharacterized protein (TIGR03435 family)